MGRAGENPDGSGETLGRRGPWGRSETYLTEPLHQGATRFSAHERQWAVTSLGVPS